MSSAPTPERETPEGRRWVIRKVAAYPGWYSQPSSILGPDTERDEQSVEVMPVSEHLELLAREREALARCWEALEAIADGEIPDVSFAEPDLISEFARAALASVPRGDHG